MMLHIGIRVAALIVLVGLMLSSGKVVLCAALYAGLRFVPAVVQGEPVRFDVLVLFAAASFLLAWLYFWLLVRFRHVRYAWWGILVAGLHIGLV